LEAVLKGANMTLKNVVKANIYLSDLSKDFNAVNEVCFLVFLSPSLPWPSFSSLLFRPIPFISPHFLICIDRHQYECHRQQPNFMRSLAELR
jgi:hypothetical protein